MLARLRKSAENKDSGFTLIELLVVMIIIGILAAIAIPAFLSQKTKAKETSAKSDATNISKDIAAAAVDGELASAAFTATTVTLTYAAGGPAAVTLTPNLTAGNKIVAASATSTTYCVAVEAQDAAGTKIGSGWKATSAGLTTGSTCP